MAMWDQVSDVTVTEPMKHLRESGKRMDIEMLPHLKMKGEASNMHINIVHTY